MTKPWRIATVTASYLSSSRRHHVTAPDIRALPPLGFLNLAWLTCSKTGPQSDDN
jgi:hypothetical protein